MSKNVTTSGGKPSESEREAECPHCGEKQVVNDGTGKYKCEDCGGDIEIRLICPDCSEELEVEEWSQTECSECWASFDPWKEAEVTPIDEEVYTMDREAECPHCGEEQVVNDGTGEYECVDCIRKIEIRLMCPNCNEELEVEGWSQAECPECLVSFDSWPACFGCV